MARVVAELLPQPRDVPVDGAVEGLVGGALREVEELLAGQHAPGSLRQDAKQDDSAVVGWSGQPPSFAE